MYINKVFFPLFQEKYKFIILILPDIQTPSCNLYQLMYFQKVLGFYSIKIRFNTQK